MPVIQIVIGIVSPPAAIALFIVGWTRGVFRPDAFDAAPARAALLTWVDMVIGMAVWLIGQVVGQTIALVVIVGVPDPEAASTGALSFTAEQQLGIMLGSVLGTIPALVFYCYRIKETLAGGLREWGLDRSHLGSAPYRGIVSLAFVLPFMFTLSMITMLLLTATGGEPPEVAHAVLEIILRERMAVKIGFIAFAVLVAPTVEEIVFRGWLQTTLRTSGVCRSRWAAILATTVVFTLIHIDGSNPSSWAALPALYILSIGLGWLYERHGNLWACIVMHMVFNATQVVLALTLFSESPKPA